MTGPLRILLALLALALVARGQEAPLETRLFEGRVTTVTGDVLVVDLGTDVGLRIGDRVRVYPEGGVSVEALVRAVTEDTSRVELQASAAVAVGDRVEFVLQGRPVRVGPTRGRATEDAPEHPPWTHPPVDWDEGVPLLAEVEVRRPEERDSTIRARTFLQGDFLRDAQGSTTTTAIGRSGVTWEGTNLFGRAGVLRLDGEVFTRHVNLEEGEDLERTEVRVDALSYEWGGDRVRPSRWAVGRFLQRAMPEFGLLDGVEWSRRGASGDRWGVSAGFLPAPDDRASTGDDVSVATWYGLGAERSGPWTARLGYQKTWHRGEPDRDLLVGAVNGDLGDGARVNATAWFDWYTSSDTTKSEGLEMTQLFASFRQPLGERSGVTLTHNTIRFPELLRNEFPTSTLEDLSEQAVSRTGVRGWHELGPRLRLDGRFEVWDDDDEDGTVVEARGTLRDAFFEGGRVSAALFSNEARFRDATGLRLRWTQPVGVALWRAEYNVTDFDADDVESRVEHVVRGGLDRPFGEGWSLAAHLEHRFGDEQDAQAAGFTLRRRW